MIESDVAHHRKHDPVRDDDQVADEFLIHHGVHTHRQRDDGECRGQRDHANDLQIQRRLKASVALRDLHEHAAGRRDQQQQGDRVEDAEQFAAERDPDGNRDRVLHLIELELSLAPDELTAVERREQHDEDEHAVRHDGRDRRRHRPDR